MSNSMYSNVDNDDIFASAMEEAEIVQNPFVQGDGEPLHAVDAARRLLGNEDEEEEVPINEGVDTGSQAPSGMGNSLLERIQQQKKQQSNTIPAGNVSETVSSMGQQGFGYPMVEEGAYSSSGSSNINIPQYSQVPGPSPYNTDANSPYTTNSQYTNNTQFSTDYKDKMITVLSAVGSAAGTVAKSTYEGTKTIYAKMRNNTNNNTRNLNGGGMAEMDYQRESLLMDPHDLEDRAAQMSGSVPPPPSTSSPSGMRAGVITHATENGNTCWIFIKQFTVDMKDLFLSASRRVQIGVVCLIIFIIWLIFFE